MRWGEAAKNRGNQRAAQQWETRGRHRRKPDHVRGPSAGRCTHLAVEGCCRPRTIPRGCPSSDTRLLGFPRFLHPCTCHETPMKTGSIGQFQSHANNRYSSLTNFLETWGMKVRGRPHVHTEHTYTCMHTRAFYFIFF